MNRHLYKFAGLEFEIIMPEHRLYKNEYRLAPFKAEEVKEPHFMKFKWADALSEPKGELVSTNNSNHIYNNGEEEIRYLDVTRNDWQSSYVRVSHNGKNHIVEVRESAFPENIALKTVLECMSLEHLVTSVDGFVLHCSYIEVEGEAILFTAPSGTGKSTQANLWKDYRGANIVNGDRAVVRLTDKGAYAEGIPFSGSSEHCQNRSLPLKAIVYLEQAPVTNIRRISGYEAFSCIWKECSVNIWNTEDIEKVSSVVEKLTNSIPVFRLACTPDVTAIEALENELTQIMEGENE